MSSAARSLRVACVEWPDGLDPSQAAWDEINKSVAAARPDLLLTNELPFGPWLAANAEFSADAAECSIRAHEEGLAALTALKVPAIISTRPAWNGKKLANEAFVLENGGARPLHRKQYFPDEPGWSETSWYQGDDSGFEIAEILGIKIGVLICTEAMFNERARAYGKQGAALIVVPRATGQNVKPWKIAAQMASTVSGAYVASSNRVSPAFAGAPLLGASDKDGGLDPSAPGTSTEFGGAGFAYGPEAVLIAVTNATAPLVIFDVDPKTAAATQLEYPCYVRE